MTAWISIVIWPVLSAPRYRRGFIFTLPMAVLTMAIGVGTELRSRRAKRKGEGLNGVVDIGRGDDEGYKVDEKGVGEKMHPGDVEDGTEVTEANGSMSEEK